MYLVRYVLSQRIRLSLEPIHNYTTAQYVWLHHTRSYTVDWMWTLTVFFFWTYCHGWNIFLTQTEQKLGKCDG